MQVLEPHIGVVVDCVDICHKELGWKYTHGKRVNNYNAGVNVSAWGPFASALFNKGYKIAKIDQVETKPTGTKPNKPVQRFPLRH